MTRTAVARYDLGSNLFPSKSHFFWQAAAELQYPTHTLVAKIHRFAERNAISGERTSTSSECVEQRIRADFPSHRSAALRAREELARIVEDGRHLRIC